MEIEGDFLATTVIRDVVYDALDMDIWKNSVQFIAKKFGVTNRTTVVFKTHTGTKNPQPPPYKWFSYKSVMIDDEEYDDDCSCGLYCRNFLLIFYIKLGRIDPGIVPNVTSELL